MAQGHGGKREGAGRKRKQISGQRQISFVPNAPQRQRRQEPEPETEEDQRQRQAQVAAAAAQAAQERAEQQAQQEQNLHRLAQDADRNLQQSEVGAADFGDFDDDFEDDSDPDYEDQDHETEEEIAADKANRRSCKYKPPRDSFLGQQLEALHTKMMATPRDSCHSWYHYDGDDPTVKAGLPQPQWWYEKNIVAMDWCPFRQYRLYVRKLQTYKCVYCGNCRLHSKEYEWRPMFDFRQIIWLHHRRVECQHPQCGRTFAEFHPDFLEQLPDRVVDTLPFETTVKGPGMHKLMIYSFMHLATKGVMYGTYANMQNELYNLMHCIDHKSFLGATKDYIRRSIEREPLAIVPKVFSPFQSVGEYNGIRMLPGLVRGLFFRVCTRLERSNQARFQMNIDEGAVADHTFKFAKGIKIPGRAGQPFKASYTVLGQNGLVNLSVFTNTKSNTELASVLNTYKQARINHGYERLLRFESDGGADRRLWSKVFPELLEDVENYKPPLVDGLPRAEIQKEAYMFFTDVTAAENWILAYTGPIDPGDLLLVAFDLEWDSNFCRQGYTDVPTRLLQLSFFVAGREDESSPQTVVFDLFKMDVAALVKALTPIFTRKNSKFLGFNTGNDISRLIEIGIPIQRWIDIRQLAMQVDPSSSSAGTGLSHMCARYLGLGVSKDCQTGDFSEDKLSEELIAYAALDCRIALQLYLKLTELDQSEKFGAGSQNNSNVKAGTAAMLKLNGKSAAEVEIEFMGASKGEQQKWGRKTIGKRDALVRLKRILSPGAKLPISFSPTPIEAAAGAVPLQAKKTLLRDLLENAADGQLPVIAVPKSNLTVLVNSLNPSMGVTGSVPTTAANAAEATSMLTTENINQDSSKQVAESTVPAGMAKDSFDDDESIFDEYRELLSESGDDSHTQCPELENIVHIEHKELPARRHGRSVSHHEHSELPASHHEPRELPAIRSRQKLDLFHRFQDVPLEKRKCPPRSAISRLLIHASYLFDESDYDAVVEHLAKKRAVVGKTAILRDFYFRREWRKRRVRMYTPTAEEHGARIDKVHEYIKNNEDLKHYYTEKLASFLTKLALEARMGQFEELLDVALFQHDGQDRYGLDLWLRKRGSTKAENFHQKLRVAFGPWSVGARTGHFLMVNTASRFNVKTGVRRNNDHDFGHTHLHIIDEIDLLAREVYDGTMLFPRHKNTLLFKEVPNFVAVGIGPLIHETEFVCCSEKPDDRLKGDLRFTAERMKVACPPLPIYGPRERKMFNDFMLRHPKPNAAQLRAHAKEYLDKTDCSSVFPKTVSILKSQLTEWKESSMIKQVESSIHACYEPLLQELAKPTSAAATRGMVATVPNSGDAGGGKEADTPIVSGQGSEQVPTALPTESAASARTATKCFYWPCCTEDASICGGRQQGKCRMVQSGRFKLPENFVEVKKAAKLEEKRRKAAEKRKKVDR